LTTESQRSIGGQGERIWLLKERGIESGERKTEHCAKSVRQPGKEARTRERERERERREEGIDSSGDVDGDGVRSWLDVEC